MSTNVIQPSFAAGEVTPSLYGRVDLGKYHTGVALAENLVVDFKGGLFNRPGTKFIGYAGTSLPRLIPFQFSTIQTYILEFGNTYIRFIANGGYVLEAAKTITGITKASPGVFACAGHGFTGGNTVYIQSVVGMVEVNGLYGQVVVVDANHFSLKDVNGVAISTTAYTTYVSGGTASRVYTIASPYAVVDLPLLKYTQTADVMTLVHQSYPIYNLSRTSSTNWILASPSFASPISYPGTVVGSPNIAGGYTFVYAVTSVDINGNESLSSAPCIVPSSADIRAVTGQIGVAWSQVSGAQYYRVYRIPAATDPAVSNVSVGANYGWIGDSYSTSLTDDNITPDMTITPPKHANPFANGAFLTVTVTAVGAGYAQATATATITTSTGSEAGLIPQVNKDGTIGNILIVNPGHDYVAGDTINIGGGGGAGATATFTLSPATGNYPGAVGYFQQRKSYASSLNKPETLWMSQPGSFNNFDKSNPTVDDDAITVTLASKQVNNIKYMIGMPGGLIALTGSGAWQVSSGQANGAVTPSQLVATPQAYTGCADVEPIIINYDIIYVQSRGNVVRDLSYNFYVNIYTGVDISLLANHLLVNYQIQEWSFVEEPYKVVWLVRNDGALLSMTYLKEQEVYGWAHHYTEGLFKSVASVQEGTENVLYMAVQRYINGFWVTCVERMASRAMTLGVEDAWFLDCALQTAMTYPAAQLTPSAISGAGVIFTADAGVFAVTDVGRILRVGGGIATIAAYTDSQHVTGTFTQAMTSAIYTTNQPIPQASGTWSISSKVTTLVGLNHLEGQTVSVLGDGLVQASKVVTGGKITIDTAASKVLVGLPFVSKMQTLPLDIGEPTVQGKRKKISALNLKTEFTQGISAGSTFTTLYPVKDLAAAPPLTGDSHFIMDPSWNVQGQICVQQSQPLPCKILAVIPEIVIGDTASK